MNAHLNKIKTRRAVVGTSEMMFSLMPTASRRAMV